MGEAGTSKSGGDRGHDFSMKAREGGMAVDRSVRSNRSAVLAAKAKFAMEEQRRNEQAQQAERKNNGHAFDLSESTWDWAHDGTHVDGKLKLLAGGKVQWDDGGEQGSWSLTAYDVNRIIIVFNNINHTLCFKDGGQSAVLEEPSRNPASQMFLQAALGTTSTAGCPVAVASDAPPTSAIISTQEAEFQRSLLHDPITELLAEQQSLRAGCAQLHEVLESQDQALQNAEIRLSRYGENPRLRQEAERARKAKEEAQQKLCDLEPRLKGVEAEAVEKQELLRLADEG